jgi:hypothetical protein
VTWLKATLLPAVSEAASMIPSQPRSIPTNAKSHQGSTSLRLSRSSFGSDCGVLQWPAREPGLSTIRANPKIPNPGMTALEPTGLASWSRTRRNHLDSRRWRRR